MSDVPIGAFLSGGVDSRLVVGLMQRLADRPIKTFTIGIGDADERADARSTAHDLGTDHYEEVITKSAWPALLERFLNAIDQPSVDGFNTLAVSHVARSHVKVALSGLGADELFSGYPHFSAFEQASSLHRYVPTLARAILRSCATRIPVSRITSLARAVERPDRFLSSMRLGSDTPTLAMQLKLPPEAFADVEDEVAAAAHQALATTTDSVNQMSLYELDTYLKDTLLRDVDVVSMHSGLEVRPVLLDTPLVELALSLPGKYKLRGQRRKAVLTDAFPDILPPDVVARPKRGFHVPAREWTPTVCASLWRETFESASARHLLSEAFRQRAARATNSRTARQDEWAAFVLLQVAQRNRVHI